MKNKKPLSERLRENPYIMTTFVFGILVLCFIIGNIIQIQKEVKLENKVLCSVIGATPSWANSDGRIIKTGVIQAMNESSDLVKDILIPNRYKMFYTESCPACQQQIELFGDSWEDYKKSGLAVNCKNYWGSG